MTEPALLFLPWVRRGGALSLPPDATLLAWCAWGLLGISGAWLLFALVVGRRIRFDPSLD